jgi:shikimate kinase
MRRHVLLVGLSGSGKSEVGRLVGAGLDTAVLDVDEEIMRRTGQSVPEFFASPGEAAFRRLERELVAAALHRPAQVVVPGGGWAVEDGNLAEARARALTVWLRVAPETAAARLGRDGSRPLLRGEGAPQEKLTDQLEQRAGWYAQAEAVVETDELEVKQVAQAVIALARTIGDWPARSAPAS